MESYQLIYFDPASLEARTEYLSIDRSCKFGTAMKVAGPFPADLSAVHRLVIYLTVLRDNPKMEPLVQLGRRHRSATDDFKRRLAIFFTLQVLNTGGVQLDNHQVYEDFVTERDDDAEVRRTVMESLGQTPNHRQFLINIKLIADNVRSTQGGGTYLFLRPKLIEKAVAVLEETNSAHGGNAFTPDDLVSARHEMNFSLQPNLSLISGNLFLRIDFWCLGEGAKSDPDVIGLIGLAFPSNGAGPWITWYGTIPHSKGLGAKLIALTCRNAKLRGCEEIYVWTTTSNSNACDIYRRFGFQESEELPADAQPVEGAISFRRSLDDVDSNGAWRIA